MFEFKYLHDKGGQGGISECGGGKTEFRPTDS